MKLSLKQARTNEIADVPLPLSSRLEEMSRKVNSLQSSASHQTPESQSASSTGLPFGPASAGSAVSFSGEDWLQLSDLETNQNTSWSLGDVVLGYQDASELLQ